MSQFCVKGLLKVRKKKKWKNLCPSMAVPRRSTKSDCNMDKVSGGPDYSLQLYRHQSHARHKLVACNTPLQLKYKDPGICSSQSMKQRPIGARIPFKIIYPFSHSLTDSNYHQNRPEGHQLRHLKLGFEKGL